MPKKTANLTSIELEERKTVDFGAPDSFGVHLFRVLIPTERSGLVTVVEDYGYRGGENGLPWQQERVMLKRGIWTAIAEPARREFNARLKTAKLRVGRWHTGTNLVERLFGKELCVLAWAAETANADQLPVICSRWAALRPEERWWLFSMTAAENGLPQDSQRGWRRALFHALSSEGSPASDKKARLRPRQKALFESALI